MFGATQEEVRAVCAAARTAINIRLSPLLVQLQTALGGICSSTIPKMDNALTELHDIMEGVKPVIPEVRAVAAHANDLLGRLNAGAEVEIGIPREGQKPFVLSVRIKPDEE